MVDSRQPALRVAIVGGGIAGLACYIALKRLVKTDLDIQIYEQSKKLCEVGASIALGPNGVRTLRNLGLQDLAGYQNSDGSDHIWRDGKSGSLISKTRYEFVTDESLRTSRFTRWHLYSGLQEVVPSDAVHLGKRLREVVALDAGSRLLFEDGSLVDVDLVIGADGIRSAVRRAFVPAHKLPFSGAVAYRDIYDWSLVADTGIPEDATHWLTKDGVSLFTSRLSNNKFAIASFITGMTGDVSTFAHKWNKVGDIAALRQNFESWTPVVKRLMDRLPYVHQYPVFTGESLERWVFRDQVALIGDAAHPHGGSFAAGGSLALDDSYALGLSLEHALARSTGASDGLNMALAHGLQLFNAVRCNHGKRVIDAVAEKKYGWLASGEEQTPNVYNSYTNEIKYPLWIVSHSVEDEFQRIVRESTAISV